MQYGNTRSPRTPCLLYDHCCCRMRTKIEQIQIAVTFFFFFFFFTVDVFQTCLVDPSVTKIVNVQVKTYKLSKLQLEVFLFVFSCISSSLLVNKVKQHGADLDLNEGFYLD